MIPGARLVLLGKQGAGKGTQCVRLARHYVISHISTGDLLRAAVAMGTELGVQVKEYMDRGDLVPEDLILGIVGERLEQHSVKTRGFILDGFPRTVGQAEALEKMLAEDGGLDLVLDLEVPTEIVLKRLSSRRVCSACGTNYGADNPPKYDSLCDFCGGEVVQRKDDTEDAIRRRLELYEQETAPLIAYYMERHKLAAVDGLGHPEVVLNRLVRAIDAHRRRHHHQGRA